MTTSAEREYVLGTDTSEIDRLSLQHSVWRADAAAAWRTAGFAPGHAIVDIGCGPGFATLDLAELVGRHGRLLAVDQSERFLAHLRQMAAAHQLADTIETRTADVTDVSLPAAEFDGAWIRWVLSFVAKPQAVIDAVARALRPGGVVAIHEYCDYRAWKFHPRDPEHDEFVAAVIASWEKRGGEPDIGFRLPVMLREAGLEIQHVRSITDIVQPDTPRWAWAMAFATTAMDRLVALGDVAPETGERLARAITRIRATAQLMAIPAVAEVIAIKPR